MESSERGLTRITLLTFGSNGFAINQPDGRLVPPKGSTEHLYGILFTSPPTLERVGRARATSELRAVLWRGELELGNGNGFHP